MDAKSRATIHLMRVMLAIGEKNFAKAKDELNVATEIILANWSINEPKKLKKIKEVTASVVGHRSYSIPGLSGGCTRGDVPLAA